MSTQYTVPSLSIGQPAPVPDAAVTAPQPQNPMPVPSATQPSTANTAPSLQLAPPSTEHMQFDDGTDGEIPQANIAAALKDGGHIVRQMQFDDGTEGWVPLANVQAAIKDGGQFGPKPVPQTYLEKTAAGPFQPAGQAEKTMGEQFGNNAAQAKEAAKDVAVGAIATLAGTLGAPWLAATFKALLPAALLSGMRLR